MVNLGNQIDVTTIKKFVDVAKDVDTPVRYVTSTRYLINQNLTVMKNLV